MASKEMQDLAKKMLASRQGAKKNKPLASKKPLAKAPMTKKVAKEAKKTVPAKKSLPKKAMKESSAAAVPSADDLLKSEVEKYAPKKKAAPGAGAPAKKVAKKGLKSAAKVAAEDAGTPPPITSAMKAAAKAEKEGSKVGPGAFAALERDLPKGGSAMRIAKELEHDGAEALGSAIKRKTTLKSLGKAAGIAGALGGVALSLMSDDPSSAMDPMNSEMAGDKDQEAMDVAENNQRQKTMAKLHGKSLKRPKIATETVVEDKITPMRDAAPKRAAPGKTRINGKDYSGPQKEGPMDGMYDAPIAHTPDGIAIHGKSDEQKAAEFHDHLRRHFGDPEEDNSGDLEKLVRDVTLDEMDKGGMKRTSPRIPVKKPVELKTGKSFTQMRKEDTEDY